MIKLQPQANHFGHDISAHIPPTGPDLFNDHPLLGKIWEKARLYLAVRNNDSHTLYALALAASLLEKRENADPNVVLPAIMLHDVGWSQVEPELVLAAIAPGGGRTDLVLVHEKEGARIATDILKSLAVDSAVIQNISEIIDGHDSRMYALNPNDEVVKDADKLWRLTPHGLDTIMDWFGLQRDQALRLCSARVVGKLFTQQANILAQGMIALERANLWSQTEELRSGA